MKTTFRIAVLAAAVPALMLGTTARATDALVPISEGSWLGEMVASCSDETGTARDYSCSFDGSAPSEFPPGSFCTETPSAISLSLECTASINATAVGKLGKAGCITTPPPSQLTTANGTVTVFSTLTQQSYAVPVKVWVTRGAGKFAGVGNYALTAVKVSGTFTTTCGVLQSRGTFEGEFTLATIRRI